MFIGVFSSPLPLTLNNTTESLAGRQEEQDLVAREWSRQFNDITMKLRRTTKQGKVVKPGSPVTKDEEWTLFLGADGFRAHAGPGGTLVAETVKSSKPNSGHPLASAAATQDLGEKVGFFTAAGRDKAFDALLTDIPALHAGNGVPKTNLAYLNGIFAYLASVQAVPSHEPPEAWMKLYNEMHAVGGSA
ncbi:hypothetical protein F5878DRAFT_657010 [Lentinula raphanica]|uniref:Uncharacterized protein n=1 Tax=Lentinula raphanica TaxID=153919 RepID=A0AA38PHQ5_9AGAR|nr:hypothetical protein F5878DRAFT_657010 [Lentinula raphanica]